VITYCKILYGHGYMLTSVGRAQWAPLFRLRCTSVNISGGDSRCHNDVRIAQLFFRSRLFVFNFGTLL